MLFGLDLYRQLVRPVLRDKRELWRFVARMTIASALVALAVDVVNQTVFFSSWNEAVVSWIVTVLLASSIASAASWAIGRAHVDLYRAKVAFQVLSRTDPLTGLPNRRAFFEAAESQAEAMILVIADIDRFKSVNDTRGHLAGDEVIRTVGQMMEKELGSLGYLGRVGGEEFALVSSGAKAAQLVAALDSFRKRLAATPILYSGGAVMITVSAGVAQRVGTATSLNDLYAEADHALYAAKREGRNCIAFAPSFDPASARDEAAWRADGTSSDQPTADRRSVA